MADQEDAPHASLDAEARADQAARLLITPEPGWVLNYSVMALLAAMIAGLGMRLDSAPIVIGAMLVAPVMRPVLGLGFACLTAVPASGVRRLFVVLAATSVGLVAVGWLITIVLPSTEVELAGEVLARTAPDIRDLLVALAAGAVGAFAILRPRVNETISGVAIAVALVPPPVAAGIALGESFGTQARGALMLYGTNLVAIVFATAVTVLGLRLLGERPFDLSRRRLVRSATVVVVLALALGIPLAGSFSDAVEEAQEERDRRVQENSRQKLASDAEAEIQRWIDESLQPNLEIVSVDVPLEPAVGEISLVSVVLLGQDNSYIPPLDGVDELVATALDRPIDLGIRLVGVADQVTSTFEVAPDIADADADALTRRQIARSLQEWASNGGVDARVLDVTSRDPGVVLARIGVVGDAPPIADLHAIFIDRMGEIPSYELVIEDLLLSPPVVRAEPLAVSDVAASAVASVDGREIDDVEVCRREGDEEYQLTTPTGSALEVTADSMTATTADGQRIDAVTVARLAEESTGSSVSFRGTFDRDVTGLGEIVVTITGFAPSC